MATVRNCEVTSDLCNLHRTYTWHYMFFTRTQSNNVYVYRCRTRFVYSMIMLYKNGMNHRLKHHDLWHLRFSRRWLLRSRLPGCDAV